MSGDENLSVPRRVAVPIVATLMLVTLVTCLICWLVASSEFHHFEQVIEKAKTGFPSFCESFRRVEFLNLVIPLAILSWAGRLLRAENCSLKQLVWFACGSILTVFLWATVSFVAVYLLHLKFYRFM